MIYRVLGVLVDSSGSTFSFTEFHENAGNWTSELIKHEHYAGKDIVELVNRFIEENELQYKIALISVHADRVPIAEPGAAIAAAIGLPVISDLAAMDIALGGSGEFFSSSSQKLGISINNTELMNKGVCIAFMGVLRWREEYNFLSFVTGATRNSIGGAVWLGQDA